MKLAWDWAVSWYRALTCRAPISIEARRIIRQMAAAR